MTAQNAIIVQAARRAVRGGRRRYRRKRRATGCFQHGCQHCEWRGGFRPVTIGGGGEGGDAHTTGEWYRPTESHLGPQSALLLVLALAGLEGVTKPMLGLRAGID